jgi:hypothetical protein
MDRADLSLAGLATMPAPITKLSDRFADYTLRIHCRKCGHARTTEPHVLAKLLGWETPLTTVSLRLRRTKCHVRGECELTAQNQPKPRGHRSEVYAAARGEDEPTSSSRASCASVCATRAARSRASRPAGASTAWIPVGRKNSPPCCRSRCLVTPLQACALR